MRYVSIGDSYTVGTGARPDQCWPTLLTRDLQSRGVSIDLVANPAHDGWTTADATRAELPIFLKSHPTFATLMIGVNDTYRGLSGELFRAELDHIVTAMQRSLPDRTRLILVTIPDYGVTPTGARYASMNGGSANVVLYNRIILEEARKHRVSVVDVYRQTQQMGNDPSLVAGDGLHPSAKEYAIWEKAIVKVALAMLVGRR
jgi:lysophospholipase L1-like esterase